MVEKSLVEKISLICENFGEEFSKGHHKIIGNLKLRHYHGKNGERVRVIEGQTKVFDYIKLKKYERFEFFGGSNWEIKVEKEYNSLNRKY